MRIEFASAVNFQSYQEIEFYYDDLGLALIAGPTKAGKSTLLDLVPWVLFGTTSKEGAADDVRSWFAQDKLTDGLVIVDLVSGRILVKRIRGKRSSDNDLYYCDMGDGDPGEPIRGKDASDTQRLIIERLGVDAELYISGSYMHQFSKADTFFIAKAKDRRDTVEKIADLSLPVMLANKASEARKTAKKDRDAMAEALAKLQGKQDALSSQIQQTERSIETWDKAKDERLDHIADSIISWTEDHVRRCDTATAWVATWEAGREERIAKARSTIEAFEVERGTRALKVAEQIALLDKTIVDPVEFDKRTEALKRQAKQLDNLNNDLKDLRVELSETKSRIKSLTEEYQRLAALGDVCPTCLGPCNNGNKQARCSDIEAELGTLVGTQDMQVERVAKLEEALSGKTKLDQSYMELISKRNDNKRLMDKRESEAAKALVIRAETNPYLDRVDLVKAEANPYTGKLQSIQTETNPFHAELIAAQAETNPFHDQLTANRFSFERTHAEWTKTSTDLAALDSKISALTWLYDKSFALRGEMLEQSVRQLQDTTNGYLERFFDAELRVKFDIQDGDKLEALVINNGYNCPYKQLSGGERCMLKLTFSIAYMIAAQNKAGIKINTMIFDESLNGLDAALKVKAFTLLQSLSQDIESLLVIDHSEELKQLFDKQFLVSKSGEYSQIEQVEMQP